MIDLIQRCVRVVDGLSARAYLSAFDERGGILAFLFHSLFRDAEEIALDHVDPLERTTVDKFRAFVAYYRAQGYRFITPDDCLGGLDPGGKYALISFDDGYFNNALALPVLEEFRVPAIFFISTDHVREGKCFWWDVLYRERRAEGATPRRIIREGRAIKTKTTEEIEADLKARFGPDVFRPRGDIDRPFTPAELRDFVRRPFVHVGNHTANHAILTNYASQDVRGQILRAQEALVEMTGVRPAAIAYPNGAHSGEILRISEEAGLRLGFTTTPLKNGMPRAGDPSQLLRLGRFTLHAESAIESQCRTYRSDVQLYRALRAGYLRLAALSATNSL